MVVRKLGNKKKEKKIPSMPKGLKVSRSIKIDSLDDVIVDGKFICELGETLIFRKDYLPDKTTSYVTVVNINIDKGLIELYDETRQQCTAAEIKDADQYALKKI